MRYIILVAVLLAACGGGSEESAGDAAKRQFQYLADAQHGRRWESLHPAHQAVASRDAFIECGDESDNGFQIEDIKIKETFAERQFVPELGEVDTMQVTASVRVNGLNVTDTYTEVAVDGQWRWTTTKDALDAYRKGECP